MDLARLESEDRGFLTWLAAWTRADLAALVARLTAGGTAPSADGTRLEALDLSPLGGALRERVGPGRRLTLPLGGLDGLVTLDCTGLDLDDLDLRVIRGLRRLRCSGNRLRSLALDGHPQLEELVCDDNPLTGLDLRGLGALRHLQTPPGIPILR